MKSHFSSTKDRVSGGKSRPSLTPEPRVDPADCRALARYEPSAKWFYAGNSHSVDSYLRKVNFKHRMFLRRWAEIKCIWRSRPRHMHHFFVIP